MNATTFLSWSVVVLDQLGVSASGLSNAPFCLSENAKSMFVDIYDRRVRASDATPTILPAIPATPTHMSPRRCVPLLSLLAPKPPPPSRPLSRPHRSPRPLRVRQSAKRMISWKCASVRGPRQGNEGNVRARLRQGALPSRGRFQDSPRPLIFRPPSSS